jgi:hypothetical protein
MASDLPAPFPDVDLPPRSEEQKRFDRLRSEKQTAMLTAEVPSAPDLGPSDPGPEELAQQLIDRRADAGEGVVHVETAPTDTGHSSLVVPRELLVRHSDNSDMLPPDVDQILQDRHFVATPQFLDEAVCPELSGRFSVYTYGSDDESQRLEDTRAAMTQIQGVGGKASPTLVAALHSGAVVKAAVGPAPTSVDQNDEAFREAGHHPPDGDTIVAVIDTGISEDLRSDGWLNEVARNSGSIDPLDEFPPPRNGFLDFAAGHGTFAAGIVRLIDPEAQIRVYAALDSDGFASETAIACAMIQAVKDGAHVLNLSLGMRTVDNEASVAFQLALEIIDEIAIENPPAIVASAGNYGNDEKVWPAASDRVISVAGLTADLQPAEWSSRGSWVTCSCVGEGIVSTFVPGDEDPAFSKHHPDYPQPDHYSRDAWAVWTGTSFAAPQIAGAISRKRREEGGIPPREAAQRLLAEGTNIPGFGKALLLLRGT